jgi:hypothetical protein
MRIASLLLSTLLALSACTPVGPGSTQTISQEQTLKLEDEIYEGEIRTVRLFPAGAPLSPAVTQLGQWDLLLEFDDLTTDRDTYNVRIIHCNYNWTQSTLQDLDFMRDYNEIPITNVQLSADTHIPYVHYSLKLPPVKIPGNYVAVVYRGTDKLDLILSRRFMVYDTRVTFAKDGNLIGAGSVADLSQQINFTINHKNVDIPNPLLDVHVSMRQNQRWDNCVTDLKPSFVRDIEKELEYRFFDESKMFKGGNEFRFFDLRSLLNPGRNVGYVDKRTKPYEVFIARDKSRSVEAYAQYDEMNGNYLVDNYDFRDPAYTQYAYVNFSLLSKPVDGDVFVSGAFNNWRHDKSNRMAYDSAQGIYKARVLLKQGWYDYQYTVRSQTLPPYHFEGSHFQTENAYEIFVYFRPFQPRADLLIGYIRLEQNPR